MTWARQLNRRIGLPRRQWLLISGICGNWVLSIKAIPSPTVMHLNNPAHMHMHTKNRHTLRPWSMMVKRDKWTNSGVFAFRRNASKVSHLGFVVHFAFTSPLARLRRPPWCVHEYTLQTLENKRYNRRKIRDTKRFTCHQMNENGNQSDRYAIDPK